MQLKLSLSESVEAITSQARDVFPKFDLLMRSKALYHRDYPYSLIIHTHIYI